MIDYSLIDAWAAWLDGQQLGNNLLWGIPILWLGRLGKILQALGAAVIVAEIVGVARINGAGDRLVALITVTKLKDRFAYAITWYLKFWRPQKLKPADLQEIRMTFADMNRDPLAFVSTAVSFLLIGLAWRSSPIEVWWINLLVAVPMLILTHLFVSTLIASSLWAIALLPMGLLGFVLFRPLGWIMARPNLDDWLKRFSFLCLIAGFHFDLLSS